MKTDPCQPLGGLPDWPDKTIEISSRANFQWLGISTTSFADQLVQNLSESPWAASSFRALTHRDAQAAQNLVGFLVKTSEIGKWLNLLILRIAVHFPGIHDSHDCGIARAAVGQYCLAS